MQMMKRYIKKSFETVKDRDVKHFIKILISVISLLLVMGCAGKTIKDMPQSGFLTDYSGFHFDPMEAVDWIYVNTETDFKSYDKLMIHHVTYFLKEDTEYRGIQSDQLNELTEIIHSTLLTETFRRRIYRLSHKRY
jgi:hypothetical protein